MSIQWGVVDYQPDPEVLRRKIARRREARRVRVRDNRIALGVLLFTMSYLAVHVAVWAARSLR